MLLSSTRVRLFSVPALLRAAAHHPCPGKEIDMEETNEPAELVERVAALDIGKAALTACIRVPHEDKPGRRCQEVREYATTTPGAAGPS